MQRYIEQLVEDLHRATWNIKKPHEIWEDVDLNNEAELEDISYVEEYVYGKKKNISDIIGIKRKLLPAPKMLTTEQRALLSVELEKLLQVFHFFLDFPETYPHELRYRFIRDFWKEKRVGLSFGECHIEFCDYDESHCPFDGYCTTCKEIRVEMEHDKGNNDDDKFDIDVRDLLPRPDEEEQWFRNNRIDIDEPFEDEQLPF